MAKARGQEDKNFVTNGMEFWNGCREELKKVSSPTRQETVQMSIVTVFLMFFIAIALFIMDFLFGKLMSVLV